MLGLILAWFGLFLMVWAELKEVGEFYKQYYNNPIKVCNGLRALVINDY